MGARDGGQRVSNRWSELWAGLLAERASARVVERGRALLRAGRVGDVRVEVGRVTGRVTGRKATPLAVTLSVSLLDDGGWQLVVHAVAGQVRHRARLLAGQVPETLDAELAGRGIGIVAAPEDLACTCDQPRPCAHQAAVWLAAAEVIADDPFAALRLRGRGRAQLLADVAAVGAQPPADETAGVGLHSLPAHQWTRAGAPLDALELDLVPPRAVAAGLRLLGDPPGWAGGVSAADLLGPLVERGATWARRQAGVDEP